MTSFKTGLAAAAVLLALAAPASAQIRAQTVDPVRQQFTALGLKIDAATVAANRQVVPFHMAPEDLTWSDADNTFPKNNERAEALCQQLLGDRYGRMLARRAHPIGDRWYFSHLVCETRP